MAKIAAAHYRAAARAAAWEPTPDDVIYRVGFHVAESDERAFADMSVLPPRVSQTAANAAINAAIAESSYYGRDETQRQRNATRDLDERIALGQLLVGGPDTVVEQIKRVRAELGAGILDCVVGAQLGDKTARSIELFGTKILPRIREL
jgi:alkanesulfonate monooxygenase SsuD/methylene tetrahydromethanopterin reductase-like flavin-dependent oxidoreductase (luciferase family)